MCVYVQKLFAVMKMPLMKDSNLCNHTLNGVFFHVNMLTYTAPLLLLAGERGNFFCGGKRDSKLYITNPIGVRFAQEPNPRMTE